MSDVAGVRVGRVRPFTRVVPDKAQALKPLEEAAEVFGAWQMWEAISDDPDDPLYAPYRQDLLDECADVVQATCNLAAAMGVDDMAPLMRACERRNGERGRYDQ